MAATVVEISNLGAFRFRVIFALSLFILIDNHCGLPDDGRVVGYVTKHHTAHAHDAGFSNGEPVSDGSLDSDEGLICDRYIPGKIDGGHDGDEITDDAIVRNLSSIVDKTTEPQAAVDGNRAHLHQDAPFTQHSTFLYIGQRIHQCGEGNVAKGGKVVVAPSLCLWVGDGKDNRGWFIHRRQVVEGAENGES